MTTTRIVAKLSEKQGLYQAIGRGRHRNCHLQAGYRGSTEHVRCLTHGKHWTRTKGFAEVYLRDRNDRPAFVENADQAR